MQSDEPGAHAQTPKQAPPEKLEPQKSTAAGTEGGRPMPLCELWEGNLAVRPLVWRKEALYVPSLKQVLSIAYNIILGAFALNLESWSFILERNASCVPGNYRREASLAGTERP
jgi:hypothetical protein